MRSAFDRLRHALSFEILALILVVPLGAVAFSMPVHDIGVVGLVSATLATMWNIFYNFVFDLGLLRFTGTTLKTARVRILHAIVFELGLLIVLMPFIVWYLAVSPWQALLMNMSFALFYMVYALCFNWAYDRIFPLPEWGNAPALE